MEKKCRANKSSGTPSHHPFWDDVELSLLVDLTSQHELPCRQDFTRRLKAFYCLTLLRTVVHRRGMSHTIVHCRALSCTVVHCPVPSCTVVHKRSCVKYQPQTVRHCASQTTRGTKPVLLSHEGHFKSSVHSSFDFLPWSTL